MLIAGAAAYLAPASQALGDRQSASARAEAEQPAEQPSDASPQQRRLQQQQLAEPSAQDLRVAAQAQAQAQTVQARLELAAAQRSEAATADEPRAEEGAADEPAQTRRQALSPAPNLDLYRRLGDPQAPAAQVDLLA